MLINDSPLLDWAHHTPKHSPTVFLGRAARVNFLDLLVATEAMILNFDAISIDKSTSDVNVKMANRIHGIVENE